ncbi:transglycosylase SLT domain-containing protein [Hydrogenophaga sp.]|uniref:transglycosylase SLT domain-containing protein n=1 Tax=Hydrogenophaga sp. TaxID=1904254 RepID=UPI00272F4CD8|nr:transglycosylase SLT domain-containing protein [Hydrogenophaga sp.]MDP2018848.1 transglycosylase SLT domain-containing protein [Hydrogenophaga sp.]MDP3166318.1 transglycosylase SLT domain-containing protein [Hydrogenophaga sp.]MDP3809668.1 transglycosylase SLT domain-containing protein [Hydrogenophaga sp.]
MTHAFALPTPTLSPSPNRRWWGAAALAAVLILSGCATVDNGQSTPAPSTTDPSSNRATTSPRLPSYRLPGNIPLSDIGVASTSVPPVTLLAAPADLWERIRRGFAMTDLDGDLVRDQERWYATRPDYIQRMTERSSRYLFHIVEEIERRNMPMELALLPFIESAFNPQAVSSARAAGMWQFMPATGESFDLKQNVFRDDRRDVLASTRAALDYLQQLHGRFGNWHLALAAYNWGQGNVNRAITQNKRLGLPTGYTDINMPLETRTYVPKLQAVKNIMARPQAFNTTLPLIGNHPFFDTVTLDRDIDVSVIARLAEVSEGDFRALNPSLKQPVVMAAGTPNILLPWDNAVIFQTKLQAHTGALASWTAWVVPTTMTVAQAASRVGMSESELREVNNIPPRMSVRAGSSLLVPRSGQRNSDVPLHVADNAQLSLQPDVVLQRSVVKARKGENLARLAQRYGVSAVSVAGWNKLAVNASLKPGQRVTLMLPKRVSLAASDGTPAKKAVASSTRKVAKSAGQPTKAKAVAKKKTTKAVASSSAKTRVASSAKADKKP